MPDSAEFPAAAWSPEQLVRLEYEWRRAQRSYAYHPIVRVVPLEGDPPAVYQIDYRIRTLEINASGQLGYAATCSVHLTLPPDFPHGPPHVRPMLAVFHPNVDAETIQIIPPWNPSNTLADVVERIGRLLAFQAYDPHNLWNPTAMDWVQTNAAYVPTDPSANLAADAGGDPLDRICRSGPATLPSLRDQVRKLSESLLSPDKALSAPDVRYFALRTRLAASLFLDSDIPESLSAQAGELDEWAAALPAAERRCALLRQISAAANSAGITGDALAEAAKKLGQQLEAVGQLATGEVSASAREILARLPGTMQLQSAHGLLRAALNKAEQRFNAAKNTLAALAEPAGGGEFPAALREMLEAAAQQKSSQVREGRAALQSKIQAAEPVVARARREAAALDRLLQWREWIDTTARARELAAQAVEWSAAGVQAYFMSNQTGTHGPFDFEQQVDLGTVQIVIRKTSQAAMEALDLGRGVTIGRCDGGELSASLPGASPGEAMATVFQPTPRCDDLALQLDYAATHMGGLAKTLVAPVSTEAADSWNGRAVTALSSAESLAQLSMEQAADTAHWSALAADLRALAPFKERLSTYHLLLRVHEALPRYQRERAAASTAQNAVSERLGAILQKSTNDLESGRTIIPNKFHKEYESLTAESERLQQEKDRLAQAIKAAAAHVTARMAVKKGTASPIGSAKQPRLTALPEMPFDMAELAAAMGDSVVLQLVTEIEGTVNTQLYFGRRPPPRVAAVPVPPPFSAVTSAAPRPESPVVKHTPESSPGPESPAAADAPSEETMHPGAEQEPAASHQEYGAPIDDPFATQGDADHGEAADSDHVDWPA